MIILLAVLLSGIAISGGVYYAVFRAMPWQLHDSDIPFSKEYEYHSCSVYSDQKATHDLTFDSFLELYQVNPEKWEFYEGEPQYYGRHTNSFRLFYNAEQEEVQVIFSKRDFLKFRKWLDKNIRQETTYKSRTKNSIKNKKSAAACQFLLEDVQKDIDKMREDAQKQIDEARELTNSIAARHMADSIELVSLAHAENEMIQQEYKSTLNSDLREVKGIYTDGQGKRWAIGESGEVMYEFMA